jgi:hypothetical protein
MRFFVAKCPLLVQESFLRNEFEEFLFDFLHFAILDVDLTSGSQVVVLSNEKTIIKAPTPLKWSRSTSTVLAKEIK